MSELRGKIGPFDLKWIKIPRGLAGNALVETAGKSHEISWRRDAQGIWIELPHGVFGYDITAQTDDDGRVTYAVSRRAAPGSWAGLAFRRAGEEVTAASASAGTRKGTRVRAQMPGKILSVSVKPGDVVTKDQPLLVMEAMKMENIIRAPQAGKISQIKISVGQPVETGGDLCLIDPV